MAEVKGSNILNIQQPVNLGRVDINAGTTDLGGLLSAIDQFTDRQVNIALRAQEEEAARKGLVTGTELAARQATDKEFQSKIKTPNPFNPTTANAFNKAIRTTLAQTYIVNSKGRISNFVEQFEKPEVDENGNKVKKSITSMESLTRAIDQDINTTIQEIRKSTAIDEKTQDTIIAELGAYSQREKMAAATRNVQRKTALITLQNKINIEKNTQIINQELKTISSIPKLTPDQARKSFDLIMNGYKNSILTAARSGMNPQVAFSMWKNASDKFGSQFYGDLYKNAVFGAGSTDPEVAKFNTEKAIKLNKLYKEGKLFNFSSSFGKSIGSREVLGVIGVRLAEEGQSAADKAIRIKGKDLATRQKQLNGILKEVEDKKQLAIDEGLPQDIAERTYSQIHDTIVNDFVNAEKKKGQYGEVVEWVNSGDAFIRNKFIESTARRSEYSKTTGFFDRTLGRIIQSGKTDVNIPIPGAVQGTFGGLKTVDLKAIDNMIVQAKTIFGDNQAMVDTLDQYSNVFKEVQRINKIKRTGIYIDPKGKVQSGITGTDAAAALAKEQQSAAIPDKYIDELDKLKNSYNDSINKARKNSDYFSIYNETLKAQDVDEIATLDVTKELPTTIPASVGKNPLAQSRYLDAAAIQIRIDKATKTRKEQRAFALKTVGEKLTSRALPFTVKAAKSIAKSIEIDSDNNNTDNLSNTLMYLDGLFTDMAPVERRAAVDQIVSSAKGEKAIVAAMSMLLVDSAEAKLRQKGLAFTGLSKEERISEIKKKMLPALSKFGHPLKKSDLPVYNADIAFAESKAISDETVRSFSMAMAGSKDTSITDDVMKGIFRTYLAKEISALGIDTKNTIESTVRGVLKDAKEAFVKDIEKEMKDMLVQMPNGTSIVSPVRFDPKTKQSDKFKNVNDILYTNALALVGNNIKNFYNNDTDEIQSNLMPVFTNLPNGILVMAYKFTDTGELLKSTSKSQIDLIKTKLSPAERSTILTTSDGTILIQLNKLFGWK